MGHLRQQPRFSNHALVVVNGRHEFDLVVHEYQLTLIGIE